MHVANMVNSWLRFCADISGPPGVQKVFQLNFPRLLSFHPALPRLPFVSALSATSYSTSRMLANAAGMPAPIALTSPCLDCCLLYAEQLSNNLRLLPQAAPPSPELHARVSTGAGSQAHPPAARARGSLGSSAPDRGWDSLVVMQP